MGLARNRYSLNTRAKKLFGESAKLRCRSFMNKHLIEVVIDDKRILISECCETTSEAYRSADKLIEKKHKEYEALRN